MTDTNTWIKKVYKEKYKNLSLALSLLTEENRVYLVIHNT
jgi:hypothetical protein